MDYWRTPAGRGYGSLQAFGSPVLAWPEEARPPGHVIVAPDVERVEVYPRPSDGRRHSSRERDGADWPAVHRRAIRAQTADVVAVVIVGVETLAPIPSIKVRSWHRGVVVARGWIGRLTTSTEDRLFATLNLPENVRTAHVRMRPA